MPICNLWCPYPYTQYVYIINFFFLLIGEFGVVYKANFIGYNNGHGSMSVAVKTIQGILACLLNSVIAAMKLYSYL